MRIFSGTDALVFACLGAIAGMSYYHIVYILSGGLDKMNFGKNKNEKGLIIGCIRCPWKIAILETDSINDINKFYREHKCATPDVLEVPKFNPREILSETQFPRIQDPAPKVEIEDPVFNDLAKDLSQNELLFLILQELRDQKLQDKPKSYYIKKSDRKE